MTPLDRARLTVERISHRIAAKLGYDRLSYKGGDQIAVEEVAKAIQDDRVENGVDLGEPLPVAELPVVQEGA